MEIEKIVEVTEEAAENAIAEALDSGLNVKKTVLIGIGAVVLIGGTLYVIKKVKPITKLRNKIAERKAAKLAEAETEEVDEE